MQNTRKSLVVNPAIEKLRETNPERQHAERRSQQGDVAADITWNL
jgi:hypothetical protein